MAFHFSNIIRSLSRRFNTKQNSTDKPTGSADSKSSATSINSAPTAVPESQLLPYAQYVTLSPEEVKFNCQTRVMASEVKYSMVTTVVNSWERDLKTIPNWDTIDPRIN